MPQMRLVPERVTKDQAVTVLSDFRNRFESGDCDEGQIVIQMDRDSDPETEGLMYLVSARYRVGNLMGQGGMRIVGSMLELPDA